MFIHNWREYFFLSIHVYFGTLLLQSFNFILKVHFSSCCFLTICSVPDSEDITTGALEQGSMCLDTLGHSSGQTVGLFACHQSGGNQVNVLG